MGANNTHHHHYPIPQYAPEYCAPLSYCDMGCPCHNIKHFNVNEKNVNNESNLNKTDSFGGFSEFCGFWGSGFLINNIKL